MNLQLFTSIIEQYTPSGYEFYASGKRENYNMKKSINDTMLMVLPNPFPINWREQCHKEIEFSIWLGKVIEIKRTTEGEQQHDPYSPLEERSGMYEVAKGIIEAMNNSEYITVVNENAEGTYYDSPDGKSVNRQVWLEIPLNVRLFNIGQTFDYYLDINL